MQNINNDNSRLRRLEFPSALRPTALSVRMESYLRIRNSLFLVSFWKRAPFHYACRPSRPGKNYGAPLGRLNFYSKLETLLVCATGIFFTSLILQ